ncbi:MAG: glycosyltransferase family 4 protein [Candidatus Moranbacteria bacterium]|jgi:glycosyltransferase involved in cell wall biosynthesis|nr:glycosyltransferase family 4 protein [Candidatus Moranbacteria bacterium]
MKIGIDGSRAFLEKRTGIEEYSYQVIKHLRDKLESHQVVLYIRKNQKVDFDLPENWKIKKLWFPYFTAQIRFSFEFLFYPVDVLFVPAHVVPPIHPKKTVVVVHGLEYEFFPQVYSRWARLYMPFVIKNSCRWALKIISVSENTKKDLMKLYGVAEQKIDVVYEGYDFNFQFPISNFQSISNDKIFNLKNKNKYLLFVGRLEERKNILGIIEAFEILKEKYQIPHKLVLAGMSGYGYDKIKFKIQNSKFKADILETGYISDEEKFELMRKVDVFLFPTFYEGFGIPVLEAQSVGTPVVAGNNSSIPEVVSVKRGSVELEGQKSALLVDVNNAEEIAETTYKLISDNDLREKIIQMGLENVKRFSWEKCASEIAKILKG